MAYPKMTHCKRGHEFDEANTRITKDGKRACRACNRIRYPKKRKVDATHCTRGHLLMEDNVITDDAGRRRRCARCHREAQAKWRRKNVERVRLWRYQTEYGLTAEQYDELLEAQSGVCKICGSASRDRRLYVDHCHKTGRVRGLLCASCNSGIGMLKDDPDVLRSAIAYLEGADSWEP